MVSLHTLIRHIHRAARQSSSLMWQVAAEQQPQALRAVYAAHLM